MVNREAERKRLVELVQSAPYGAGTLGEYFNKSYIENCIVQHLLDNDVFAPPVKVGQTVYVDCKTWRQAYLFVNYPHTFIKKKYYIVADVVSIIKTRKQTLVKLGTYNKATFTREYERYPISAIGKTVFPTREEAEKALQKRGVEDD